LGTKRQL